METLVKPRQLHLCLILMVITLVYELIYFIAVGASAVAALGNVKINNLAIYSAGLASTSLFVFLIYKILKARPWARVLWTLLTIFYFLTSLATTFDYEKYPVALAILTTTISIIDIIILVLLWNPEITRWFKAMKMTRLHKVETAAGESMDASDQTNDGQQNLPDSTIIAAEIVDKRITSNKPLIIHRMFRSIYILIITCILMIIVAFYGNAANIIGRFPMTQNIDHLINVDRSVSLAVLVIFIISIGYVIIEYIFNKKIQSYSLGLNNKSYSKKTILFLSYLYLVFFFFLNYLIANLLINQGYSNTRYIISYTLLNLATIYVVYRCLVKKIDNKKSWMTFWIIAFILSYIMPSHLIFRHLFPSVVSFFSDSVLFLIKCISFWRL